MFSSLCSNEFVPDEKSDGWEVGGLEAKLNASRSRGLLVHRLSARNTIQEIEYRSGGSEEERDAQILHLQMTYNFPSQRNRFTCVGNDHDGNIRGIGSCEIGSDVLKIRRSVLPESSHRGPSGLSQKTS